MRFERRESSKNPSIFGRFTGYIFPLFPLLPLHSENGIPIWGCILCSAFKGRRPEGKEVAFTARNTYIPAYYFASICSGLGEIDECFDWLFKAIENQESMILFLINDPGFDPLRSHPRYKALLRKMNLEP